MPERRASLFAGIAKKCGVSVATVSNILNGKPGASEATRELVLKTAEKMEYMPSYVAKSLKTRNTRNIGVIAEDMTIFSIPDIIDGITEYCEKVDYKIFLTNLRLFKKYNDRYYHRDDYYNMVKQEIKKFVAMQTEGIIYVTAHERVMHCIPENLSIPAVMAYGYTESRKIPSIVVDDQKGAYELIGYLIEKGHRKIGYLKGKYRIKAFRSREVGYKTAMKKGNGQINMEYVVELSTTMNGAYKDMKLYLEKKPQMPTAFFADNDMIALGAMKALQEMGYEIPKDISIIGFDDLPFSEISNPPLTTLRVPKQEMGRLAVKKLLEAMEENVKIKTKTQVCTMFVERESVQDLLK